MAGYAHCGRTTRAQPQICIEATLTHHVGLGGAAAFSAALPLARGLRGQAYVHFNPASAAFFRANLTWSQRNGFNLWTLIFVNTPRSFVASLLSSLETTVVGAELPTPQEGFADGAGTENK